MSDAKRELDAITGDMSVREFVRQSELTRLDQRQNFVMTSYAEALARKEEGGYIAYAEAEGMLEFCVKESARIIAEYKRIVGETSPGSNG